MRARGARASIDPRRAIAPAAHARWRRLSPLACRPPPRPPSARASRNRQARLHNALIGARAQAPSPGSCCLSVRGTYGMTHPARARSHTDQGWRAGGARAALACASPPWARPADAPRLSLSLARELTSSPTGLAGRPSAVRGGLGLRRRGQPARVLAAAREGSWAVHGGDVRRSVGVRPLGCLWRVLSSGPACAKPARGEVRAPRVVCPGARARGRGRIRVGEGGAAVDPELSRISAVGGSREFHFSSERRHCQGLRSWVGGGAQEYRIRSYAVWEAPPGLRRREVGPWLARACRPRRLRHCASRPSSPPPLAEYLLESSRSSLGDPTSTIRVAECSAREVPPAVDTCQIRTSRGAKSPVGTSVDVQASPPRP